MKQMTSANAEYAGKRKQTRKELFLIEMNKGSAAAGNVPADRTALPQGWER